MSQDRRYQLQHLGDMFVDALSSVTTSARRRARNVVLAYDTRDLEKKRRRCLTMIGSRIVQVRKAGLADLTRDDTLMELIEDVAQIDRAIASIVRKTATSEGGSSREAAGCQGHPCAAEIARTAALVTAPS